MGASRCTATLIFVVLASCLSTEVTCIHVHVREGESGCPSNPKMSSENMTLLDCECLPGFYESDDADSTNSTN